MKISKLTASDIPVIVDMEKRMLYSSLGEDFLLSDLNNPNALYVKVSDKDKLAGYIGIRINDDRAEVLNIVIAEDYHHQGYGTYLMNYVFDYLKKNNVKSLILEVRRNNEQAIKFYEKLGFKHILTRKNYYGDTDGLVYIKEDIR